MVNIYIGNIRLPVVEPTFEIEEVHDNSEHQIVGFGGVNLIGKRALKTFNYSSFYPKRYDSSYCSLIHHIVVLETYLILKNL